ncbi:MAG: efflux RND transporter periplasmic adaptor subunit [Robiginitomaculum sp.]|nr:efflux RND transporter periplasmic adaptor subunit [Robiginitomaculum sp.]
MKNSKYYLTLSAVLLLGTATYFANSPSSFVQEAYAQEADNHDDHDEEGGDEHGEEEGVIEMDAAERRKNGVTTAWLALETLSTEITAPGEIILNQYKTSRVTPRISAQITKRHAKLGAHVKRGNSLVTLTSVELAEAQGNAIVTNQEWQRVKALGQDVVSKRRYVEAKIAAQLTKAKIAAFGMTPTAIKQLLASGDAAKATGTFTLFSGQSGTVMQDDFVLGEIIQPGRVLFEISDESTAWVNVRVPSDEADHIKIGAPVRLMTGSGNRKTSWKQGKVLQLNHQVDEATRTFSVRVEMDNKGDELHAGQFVTAYLQTGKEGHKVLAAPVDAVTFMEGKNIVFAIEGDELHPTPVEIGAKRGNWVEIKSGISEGTEIATSEIFLLKSLILKSKMGSGHGH